jgi:hypothetical protein
MALVVVDKEDRAAAYVAKPNHTVLKILLWLRPPRLAFADLTVFADTVLHMQPPTTEKRLVLVKRIEKNL